MNKQPTREKVFVKIVSDKDLVCKLVTHTTQ